MPGLGLGRGLRVPLLRAPRVPSIRAVRGVTVIRPRMVFHGVFFNDSRLVRSIARAEREVLSKAGAFMMTTARGLIKSRKSISRPGQPPNSHRGTLKRNIYFGYDLSTRTVVVGAAKLANSNAPAALEFGGHSVINPVGRAIGDKGRPREKPVNRGVSPQRRRNRARRIRNRTAAMNQFSRVNRGRKRAFFRPRPYMGPAYDREIGKFPELWNNSVRP